VLGLKGVRAVEEKRKLLENSAWLISLLWSNCHNWSNNSARMEMSKSFVAMIMDVRIRRDQQHDNIC
jgi:hypothetical protein